MPAGPGYGEVAQQVKNRYPTWEYNLIRTLGGTPNYNNLRALDLWAQKEGVTDTAHNWLAVSNPGNFLGVKDPSYLSGNPDSIAQFASTNAGVNGIAEFLKHGYPDIIKAITNPNSSVSDIGRAVAAHSNAWGGDGAYILAHSGDPLTTPPYVTPGDSQVGPGGASAGHGSTSFSHCTGATIIGGGGLGVHWNILNSCQAKALAGGLLVGLGGVIMAGGLVIVATGALKSQGGGVLTSAAKALPGPAGKVAGLAASPFRRSGSSRAVKAPSQPQVEVFEGRRLSPQQSAYRRERGDRALSEAFARQRKAGVVKS